MDTGKSPFTLSPASCPTLEPLYLQNTRNFQETGHVQILRLGEKRARDPTPAEVTHLHSDIRGDICVLCCPRDWEFACPPSQIRFFLNAASYKEPKQVLVPMLPKTYVDNGLF